MVSDGPDNLQVPPWKPRTQDYLTYSHVRKIDDGRLVLPRAAEGMFDSDAFLWVGPQGQLRLYPGPFWLERARRLDALQVSDSRFESQAKDLFERSVRISVDVQGRVVLPKDIRNETHIGAAVRLVGRGSWFDIIPYEGEAAD